MHTTSAYLPSQLRTVEHNNIISSLIISTTGAERCSCSQRQQIKQTSRRFLKTASADGSIFAVVAVAYIALATRSAAPVTRAAVISRGHRRHVAGRRGTQSSGKFTPHVNLTQMKPTKQATHYCPEGDVSIANAIGENLTMENPTLGKIRSNKNYLGLRRGQAA